MIAIDSNVLLRHLLQDHPRQSRAATRLIKSGERVLITDVALVETVWTLTGKRCRATRKDVTRGLQKLMAEPGIIFEHRGAVWRALRVYVLQAHDGFGFVDALLVFKSMAVIAAAGAIPSAIYSYDKVAQKLPLVQRPR